MKETVNQSFEERESEFSDDYSEKNAEIEAFKLSLKKAKRTKKYLLAAIPIFVVAVIWIVIIISAAVSAASKSVNKFDISCGSMEYVTDAYIKFDINIENTSKHDASEIDILLSFYDENTLIGTLQTHTTTILYSESEKTYTVKFNDSNFDREAYNRLCESDLSKINIKTEITEIEFLGESSGIDSTYIYIFIAAISVGICAGWVVHVYFNTYCKKCKTPLVVKTVGRRVVDRHAASWDETRSIKDKKGNELYQYSERVYGEEVEYEYKRKCNCCGDITYRRSTKRIAK